MGDSSPGVVALRILVVVAVLICSSSAQAEPWCPTDAIVEDAPVQATYDEGEVQVSIAAEPLGPDPISNPEESMCPIVVWNVVPPGADVNPECIIRPLNGEP